MIWDYRELGIWDIWSCTIFENIWHNLFLRIFAIIYFRHMELYFFENMYFFENIWYKYLSENI